MAIKKRKRMTFEKSSGNVFTDIGFANPEREQLKAYLTLQIYRIIKDRELTQAQAGHNTWHQTAPCLGADAQPFRKFFSGKADGLFSRAWAGC